MGDADEVLKLARAIQKHRHYLGFLFESHLLGVEQRHDEAVRVLKQGLAAVPKSVPLLHALAEHLLFMRRLRESEDAVIEAHRLGGDPISGGMILAKIRFLEGRPREALTLLRSFELGESSPDVRLGVQVQIATILLAMEQYEAVFDALDGLEVTLETDPELALKMRLTEALAWFDGRNDSAKAIEAARLAYAVDPAAEEVLGEIVRFRNLTSPQVRGFHVLVCGSREFPFLAKYRVAAENPDQAFRFIQELEPPEISAHLQVEEAEELAIDGEPPKLGVDTVVFRNVG